MYITGSCIDNSPHVVFTVKLSYGWNWKKFMDEFNMAEANCMNTQWCIFFILLNVGWLGKKYDDLLRKNVNIRGKRWENRKKGKIFTVLGGKSIIFGKGGGKNINYLDNIHPCEYAVSTSIPNDTKPHMFLFLIIMAVGLHIDLLSTFH